jgi:O-acetyl-ADP-ribose deacetylase (regulator of RNase III)
MKEIKGDLIALAKQGEFDVIAHGCNCFVKMGAGIAKSIRLAFPEAWYADKDTKAGDKKSLELIPLQHVAM